MKLPAFSALWLAVLISSTAMAQEGRFGAGVELQVDPLAPAATGGLVTLGGRLGGPIGVNAAMGTILGSKASRLLLQADVQFFPGNGLRSDGGPIRPYAGVGGRVGFGSGADHGGIRAPFGFLYEVSGSPLDFFVEAAPVLDIWSGPAAVFVIDGALGMRYVIARTRTVNP